MKKTAVYLIVLILMICLARAEFNFNKNTSKIEAQYYGGDVVRGKINMSFTKQKNANFGSNFEGGISLLELLEEMNYNSSRDFTCMPANCKNGYTPLAGAETQDIDLRYESAYGFKIKEEKLINNTRSLKFKVTTNDDYDCNNTLFIDLFDDGTIDFYNTNASGFDCPYSETGNFGCFDSDRVTRSVAIGAELYCELIENLPPAPSYRIGAIVNKTGPGTLGFGLIPLGSGCDAGIFGINDSSILLGNRDVSIVVKYPSIEKFDALVCIYTHQDNEGNFFIRVNEGDGDNCGINYDCSQSISRELMDVDYEIYAVPQAYAPIGEVEFNDKVYKDITGRTLIDDLNNYLKETYGNNCSNGCIIPFRLGGNGREYTGQKIHSASLMYNVGGKLPVSKQIYSLMDSSVEISSKGYLILDVEKMGFKVPDSNGQHTFRLDFDGRVVTSEKINVNIGFSFDVVPKFAYVGRATSFSASTKANVSRSVWDFGDGSAVVYSDDKSAQHTYINEGNFVIQTTLISPAGSNSTKRFKVAVGEAKTSADLTLKDYEARLRNIEAEINALPEWTRASIKNQIGLDSLKTSVTSKRAEYNLKAQSASTPDEDYAKIINDLLSLNVPYSVFINEIGTLPALVGFDNINVEHIKSILNSESEASNGEIKASIIGWMERNYDVSVDFQTVSASGDLETSPLLRMYKLNIIKRGGANLSYLVIDYPKSEIVFKSQAAAEETISGGTYIEFGENSPSEVEFLILGNTAPSVAELGVYISPPVTALSVSGKPLHTGTWYQDEEGQFNWKKFLIGIAILLIATFAVYLLLQAWYKKYYERHLFKNPNDLYNLINFIYNSRKAGLRDSVIKIKLKEKRWSSEQIVYSFRKLEGKRTGMWEIPIFKFMENRKVMQELEKKQGGPIDTKFIKHPSL